MRRRGTKLVESIDGYDEGIQGYTHSLGINNSRRAEGKELQQGEAEGEA